MKRTVLRTLSESFSKIMKKKSISAKDLAQKSKICYSSLIPILNGNRDFGVTKLITIANTLGCTTDDLLDGLLLRTENHKHLSPLATKPKYMAVFISMISVTYGMIYDIESQDKEVTIFQFALGCGQASDEFIDNIITSTKEMLTKNFKHPINNKDVAVFVSIQQYEGINNRIKIQNSGDSLFAKFIIEPDAITNYRALFGSKNGICITINDGSVIIYSSDHGNTFIKLQGYGFPIADTAGNEWIGCEAIKHVINVKEKIEPSSLLSDRIFALFNNNIDDLSENVMLNSVATYAKASAIVKELIFVEPKPYEIVKKSADLLLKRIHLVDEEIKMKLPIILAGDLANVYKNFFPKNRIINIKDKLSNLLLDCGIDSLQKAIKNNEE